MSDSTTQVVDNAPDFLGTLAEKVGRDNVIPFFGAGASTLSSGTVGGRPPTGHQLARSLAMRTGLRHLDQPHFEDVIGNLALVASYYQKVDFSRPDLNFFLNQQIGDPSFQPNELHRLVARAARRRPMLIVTTNYDDLIERAFDNPYPDAPDPADREPVPYEVVATAVEQLLRMGSQPRQQKGMIWHRRSGPGDDRTAFTRTDSASLVCTLEERSVIYKVHGSVKSGALPGGYIIAEEDYARFLGRMQPLQIIPGTIKTLMGKEAQFSLDVGDDSDEPWPTFLFLGYGMHDWNLRVLLDELGLGLRPSDVERHYAILRDPDPVEAKLLEQTRIKVIDADLDGFVQALRVAANI